MNASAVSNFSLLVMFDRFYQEIGDIKQALMAPLPNEALAKIIGSQERINDSDQARAISTHLRHLIDDQQKQVSRFGSAADNHAYRTAQYFMAALTDELFLIHIDWHGQDDWLDHMLEQALFGTSLAGQRFFAQVDKLLKDGRQDANNDELAAIALLALRLGFSGIYRRRGKAVLARYRSRLYRMVGNASDFDGQLKLFPSAYENPLNPVRQSRLAPLSKWHRISVIALVIYTLLSSILWSSAIAPISALLQR